MNINNILKQAQQMQQKLAEAQAEIVLRETEGQAGGGMVKVLLNGKGEARRVQIDPALLAASEKEVLEDLIVAAINDAKGRIEKDIAGAMGKVTEGMNLPPGFKLPF